MPTACRHPSRPRGSRRGLQKSTGGVRERLLRLSAPADKTRPLCIRRRGSLTSATGLSDQTSLRGPDVAGQNLSQVKVQERDKMVALLRQFVGGVNRFLVEILARVQLYFEVAQPLLPASGSEPLDHSQQPHRLGCLVLYSLFRIRETKIKVGSEGVVHLQKFTYRPVCSYIFATSLFVQGHVSSIPSLSRKSAVENSCTPRQAVITNASVLTVCQSLVP